MFVSRECLSRQVEVSATGRSLVQRSPTDCGVSECDQMKINNLDTYCEWIDNGRTTKRCYSQYKQRLLSCTELNTSSFNWSRTVVNVT
jgi:hypothetical protein